jgi:hypothetical protein
MTSCKTPRCHQSGLEKFAESLEEQQVEVVQVDGFRPPVEIRR